MSIIAIRPFVAADLDPIATLWVESWELTYPAIDFKARRAWFCERIEHHLAQGVTVLVAEYAGQLAGLVTVDGASGWIDQIVVAAALKGLGVGDALMRTAEQHASKPLSLDVNADNARAVSFYRRQGFVEVSEYRNPADALILRMQRPRP